jgi:hypothetical protein
VLSSISNNPIRFAPRYAVWYRPLS